MGVANMNRATLFSCCVLILAISAFFRLFGINEHQPQAYELNWQTRSHTVVEKIESGNLRDLTTHLGHPGVPAALMMAAGGLLVDRYNQARELLPGNHGYIDLLEAYRITIALVTSFIPLILFLGIYRTIRPGVALLASLLLALDPRLIGLSRIAHIDATLTLLVLCTCLLFFLSIEKRSLPLKILAGLFWGLCIATKPTAISLLAIFFAYKLIRRLLIAESPSIQEPIVSSSDIYALISGHLSFVLIYTRLWEHPSEYSRRLGVSNPLADFVYWLGAGLQNHILLSSTALLVLLGASAACSSAAESTRLITIVSTRARVYYRLLGNWLLGLACLGVVLSLVPQIFENIILFWTWVFGLSGQKHYAYVAISEPPTYGYVSLLFSELPSVAVLGLVIAIFILLRSIHSFLTTDWKDEDLREILLPLASAIAVILWIFPLAISDKQSIRYLAPVFPFIYLLVGWGYWTACKLLQENLSKRLAWIRYIVSLAFVLLVVNQIRIIGQWYPDYSSFANSISGGLDRAFENGTEITTGGIGYALSQLAFLEKYSQETHVSIADDSANASFEYDRLYPDERNRPKLIFHQYPTYSGSDYLITSANFARRYADLLNNDLGKSKVIYTYDIDDFSVLSLYQLAPESDRLPMRFELQSDRLGWQTGNRVKVELGGQSIIEALPDIHKKGFMLYNAFARLRPGTYDLTVPMRISPMQGVDPSLTPERYALKIELSQSCQRTITLADLPMELFAEVPLRCAFDKDVRAQIRVYWWGNIPVQIGGPLLEETEVIRPNAQVPEGDYEGLLQ